MKGNLLNASILKLKSWVYNKRGEPYRFGKSSLRFRVGTRPVRIKYRTSPNANVRNDALQVELILKSLNEGDTAIDVGSHAGEYGVLMAARSGRTGNVVCFEPDPVAFAQLQGNISLNPNIKPPILVQAACNDTSGSVKFFSQGGNSQSSFAKSALPKNRISAEMMVQTIRLDDWWLQNKFPLPKLIKIDTEGAEINVLRGMPMLLASNATIVCELHPFAWAEMGVTLEGLAEVVRRGNRKMKWLDGSGDVNAPVEYGTALLERL
jgi:FkbM family methyltransferase